MAVRSRWHCCSLEGRSPSLQLGVGASRIAWAEMRYENFSESEDLEEAQVLRAGAPLPDSSRSGPALDAATRVFDVLGTYCRASMKAKWT